MLTTPGTSHLMPSYRIPIVSPALVLILTTSWHRGSLSIPSYIIARLARHRNFVFTASQSEDYNLFTWPWVLLITTPNIPGAAAASVLFLLGLGGLCLVFNDSGVYEMIQPESL